MSALQIEPAAFSRIAEVLGLTVPAVRDLADDPGEAKTSLSLRQLLTLVAMTGVSYRELLGLELAEPEEGLTPHAFCARIQVVAAAAPGGLAEVERRVGWELGGVMDAPESLFDRFNWDALCDVARELGVEPSRVLLAAVEKC